MKKSYRIQESINTDIKVGDTVRLIDGSGLTHFHFEGDYYINKSYPSLTRNKEALKDIDAVVVKTGITTMVCTGVMDIVRLQDCVIHLGNTKFRTCSGYLRKI